MKSAQATSPVLLSVEECQAALNLGRTKIYELLSAGSLPSVRVGRRRLVRADELAAWVNSLGRFVVIPIEPTEPAAVPVEGVA
jgi:excisionase family DNA binding protein